MVLENQIRNMGRLEDILLYQQCSERKRQNILRLFFEVFSECFHYS